MPLKQHGNTGTLILLMNENKRTLYVLLGRLFPSMGWIFVVWGLFFFLVFFLEILPFPTNS